ncbi:MAG: acylphosphatase [Planctomycetes bacterium]|nr:acylphosphatase [Planctomycetota bacterium]
MAAQRRVVRFRGNVQGVGFRHTTLMVARAFDVTGTVRNAPDGAVEAVIEGEPAEIDAFVDAIGEHMGGYIRDVDQRRTAATGEFHDFNVRF